MKKKNLRPIKFKSSKVQKLLTGSWSRIKQRLGPCLQNPWGCGLLELVLALGRGFTKVYSWHSIHQGNKNQCPFVDIKGGEGQLLFCWICCGNPLSLVVRKYRGRVKGDYSKEGNSLLTILQEQKLQQISLSWSSQLILETSPFHFVFIWRWGTTLQWHNIISLAAT